MTKTRSSKTAIHASPVYQIDFTLRTQVKRDGQMYIRYGARPDAAEAQRPLARDYRCEGGNVSLSYREPPSQTEHYDLGLQGKL